MSSKDLASVATEGLAGFVSGCILKPYRTAFYSPAGGNKIDKILSDKNPICSSASNHDGPVLRACTKPGGWGIKIKTGFEFRDVYIGEHDVKDWMKNKEIVFEGDTVRLSSIFQRSEQDTCKKAKDVLSLLRRPT